MFEPVVFWKQMYCFEEGTCDIVGTFRRPVNCAPLVTPYMHGQVYSVARGFEEAIQYNASRPGEYSKCAVLGHNRGLMPIKQIAVVVRSKLWFEIRNCFTTVGREF